MARALMSRSRPAMVAATGLSALAGLAQAASLAWPGTGQPVWWLQWLSMLVLAGLLHHLRPSGRQGAWLGFSFALAWLCGTFWWLFISLHTYGGLAAPLAAAAVLALAAFLALYYAAALWSFCKLAPANKALAAMLFAALWLLAELVRGTWFTGFPWGAGGYAHVQGPLASLPRWVGVYGVGAVSAGLAMACVQCRGSDLRRWSTWVAVLAVVAVGGWAALQRHCAVELCYTPSRAPAPPLSLALLQGNIPQDEKFEEGSGVPLALQWYAQQLRSETATLVVAPETAIPLLPQQLIPGYLEGLQARYTEGAQAALVGIPLGNARAGYTNSVLGWRPSSPSSTPGMPSGGAAEPVYTYSKHHLVPFGEFIPPLFKWFTAMLNIPLGDFNRGTVGQASFEWAGQRIAPNICYEDLFGEELAARFADPAQAPTVMVNFSNIGWFGNTLAIDQHLQISRMRTLELERPMVRATNTGATAIIDHRGVVTHQLERHTRGVLRAEVQGRGQGVSVDGGVTPFAWWASRWGLWPLWCAGLLVVCVAWVARRRGPAPGGYSRPLPFGME
ncbi:apolipoprotein N-acyltransferase [Acidovorax sp. 56]|uniref:apolipoprotein N-acyltransferase n=1 Tax=Acidovorax sp. 56 TaxID=2035205 RepID=UPI000C166DE0|nr:apolipoprotein N-acyltransferase [Acidovorax sp. 56]PIF28742.1 apolipoprotein N-acyltransferase [Acidovorax sp. 56]